MDTSKFLDTLDQSIQNKHLLTNPFYLAWNRGELSLACLQEYAKQYYHHVSAFPTYLSALHSHTTDPLTRKELLKNLIEEEAGFPNHPDLWRIFTKSLGVTDAEIDQHQPNKAMAELISTFRDICQNSSVASGIASLYAYESQIPSVSESKIHGLKTHYALTNPKDWAYFTVHIEADKEHAESERLLLARHVNPKNELATLQSTEKVLDCLWNFLLSLCDQFQIECKV